MDCSCLCLGPESSGKTLLLKRLQAATDTDLTITPTVETVGTNIVPIPRKAFSSNDKEKSKRSWDEKDVIGIREIGGSMAPLWPSYYASANLVIFVIDSSSLFQVSISTVMLMEMLSHEKLVATKFLIILAKKDLTSRKKLNHLKFMMRLDEIARQIGNRATVAEVSSITGDGVEAVRTWIINNSPIRSHGHSRK